ASRQGRDELVYPVQIRPYVAESTRKIRSGFLRINEAESRRQYDDRLSRDCRILQCYPGARLVGATHMGVGCCENYLAAVVDSRRDDDVIAFTAGNLGFQPDTGEHTRL